MSDAAAAGPTVQPDSKPSRSGRLLGVIRKLIDYGRDLAATIRERTRAEPAFAKHRFGTADLALIFKSITRGLLLANALEARVLRCAAQLDKGPRRPARPAAQQAPAPTEPRSARNPPATRPVTAADTRLAQLPTAEQIAADIRRRPIAAVIADVFYDLGIPPSHPLWREVSDVMMEHGGSPARLLSDLFDRTLVPIPRRGDPVPIARPPTPALPATGGTGPPSG